MPRLHFAFLVALPTLALARPAPSGPPTLPDSPALKDVSHVQIVGKWELVREGDLLMTWREHLIAYDRSGWRVLDGRGQERLSGAMLEGDPLVLIPDSRVEITSRYGDDRLELVRGNQAFVSMLRKGDRPLAGPLVSGDALLLAVVRDGRIQCEQWSLTGGTTVRQSFTLRQTAGQDMAEPVLLHVAPSAEGVDLLLRDGLEEKPGSTIRLVRMSGGQVAHAVDLPEGTRLLAVGDDDGLTLTLRTDDGFSLLTAAGRIDVEVPRGESFAQAGPLQALGDGRLVVVTSKGGKAWIHGFTRASGTLVHQGRADLQLAKPLGKAGTSVAGTAHRVLDAAVSGDRAALVIGTPMWEEAIGADVYTIRRGALVELEGTTKVTSVAWIPSPRVPDMFQVQEGWDNFLDVQLTPAGAVLHMLDWVDAQGTLRRHVRDGASWTTDAVDGAQIPETNLLFTSRNGVFRDLGRDGTLLLRPSGVQALPEGGGKRWTFGVHLLSPPTAR